MDLTGTTCLVTGANRGIGLAISRALAQRPVRLLAGVRSPERYEGFDPPPGGATEIRPVRLDLSSPEAIERDWAELGEERERIDVLVNNAGLMTGGLLEEQDMQRVYAMLQVNLLGLIHLTRLALPSMLARDRGKIVNQASISAYAYFPAATTYAAGKAGVAAFTQALRRELRGTGVTTLELVTGGVKTEMLDETDEVYGRHLDTSGWQRLPADEWAGRVVRAIESDDDLLGPGGKTAIAKLASRGPALLLDTIVGRSFRRAARD